MRLTVLQFTLYSSNYMINRHLQLPKPPRYPILLLYGVILLYNLLSFVNPFSCTAQVGCAYIGGAGKDYGNRIINTKDGGFAIAGGSTSFSGLKTDCYILKLDSLSNIEWTSTIGIIDLTVEAADIIQTTDGGYLVTGKINKIVYPYDYDVLISKLDSAGKLQWSKAIGGPKNDYGKRVLQDNEGNIFVLGWYSDTTYNNIDTYIIKLDDEGNMLWNKIYGDSLSIVGKYFTMDGQGNFLIIGGGVMLDSNANQIIGLSFMQLDKNGNYIFTRALTGFGGASGGFYSIKPTQDNGYVLLLSIYNYFEAFYDVLLVKLDSLLNIEWTKSPVASALQEGYEVIETREGGYLVVGEFTGGTQTDAYLAKFSKSGNIEWSQTVGSLIGGVPKADYGTSVIQLNNGDFMITGGTAYKDDSTGMFQRDLLLARVGEYGETCCPMGSIYHADSGGVWTDVLPVTVYSAGVLEDRGIQGPGGGVLTVECGSIVTEVKTPLVPKLRPNTVFPNPSNGIFNIGGLAGNTNLFVYNILGKQILHKQIYATQDSPSNYVVIDLSGYPSGVYFLHAQSAKKMNDKNSISYQKLILIGN